MQANENSRGCIALEAPGLPCHGPGAGRTNSDRLVGDGACAMWCFWCEMKDIKVPPRG
jgi:hypothetical protein